MAYSDKVVDHYNNPRNVGSFGKETPGVGTGLVGAPECGDVMKLQIRVNLETGVIEDAKFKTFGCGSAIASSSLATEWLKGKTIDEAMAIKNTAIVEELALPPTHRFNTGFNLDGPRFLGSASVNYSDKAFWSDVLTSPYHGFTDAYTMVNGSFGMKWAQGRVTTLVKATNIFNKDIQQHIFGDIIKRSVMFEVRFKLQ